MSELPDGFRLKCELTSAAQMRVLAFLSATKNKRVAIATLLFFVAERVRFELTERY